MNLAGWAVKMRSKIGRLEEAGYINQERVGAAGRAEGERRG